MPSPIVHISAGYAIYRIYKHKLPKNRYLFSRIPLYFLIIAILSLLPDLDALFGLIFRDMEHYHNNLTHSLFFGLLVALVFSGLARWIFGSKIWIWFMVALLSYELHVILDVFTGERGVMLLWPLVQHRFSSPVKLFYGLQWGLGFFSIWHLWTIFTESLFFLVVFFLLNFFDKRRLSKSPGIIEAQKPY